MAAPNVGKVVVMSRPAGRAKLFISCAAALAKAAASRVPPAPVAVRAAFRASVVSGVSMAVTVLPLAATRLSNGDPAGSDTVAWPTSST